MNKHNMKTTRLWLAAALLVAGCAGQTTHREGMSLLEQGDFEQALARLEEAVRQAPDDMEIRKDYRRAREEAGKRLIAAGNAARAAERLDLAEQAYARAMRLDPGNGRAQSGLEAVRMDQRHAAIVAEAQTLFQNGDLDSASARLKQVFLENPNHGRALQLQRQVNERIAKQQAPSPSLKANFQKPVTLQFRDANLRMVLESISRTTGINILIDKDVRPDLRATIFVKGTSVEDTIDLLLMQNQLEKKVLSDNTLFIYPNVPAKVKEYQDLKVRSFHLVNADVKQMQAMIRTILKTRDLFVHEKTNSLIMRDTPEVIRLAEKLIADQDIAEPEVMLEVEVLEIAHTRLSELGIRWPDQLTLTPQPTARPGDATPPTGFTLGALSRINRENVFITPIPSITLNAHLDDSDTNVLASPRIRARNREKARIHIGDRVPVLTNSVTPVASGSPVVTGSVQYIDVGLKLEVEPDIHTDGEVGIKINLEVSNIVNQVSNPVSGTVAYQIGTRTTATVLRLKDGETQVLAGLIDDQDRRTAAMVPGLGELPVLGRLFSTHGTNGKKSEIVLSITPRLVGKTNQQDAQSVEFWSGTEANMRSAPLSLRQTGAVSLSTGSAAQQPARTTPLPATPPRAPQPAPALQPNSFRWQGPAQAKVGDRFTVTLLADAREPVKKVGLQVSYDPAALKAVDAVEGTFLKQQNLPSSFTRDINESGGQITVELAGTGEQGARGSGSVASITFEVVAPSSGPSEISVASIAPSGTGGETLSYVQPNPHRVTLNP
jgi:general secretion pathway protein D